MIEVSAKYTLRPYHVLRQVLDQLEFQANSDSDYFVLNLIDPCGNHRKKIDRISLTDNMNRREQLRYFQTGRLNRWLRLLGVRFRSLNVTAVLVWNSNEIDAESDHALKVLRDVASIEVRYTSRTQNDLAPSRADILSKSEGELLSKVALADLNAFISVGSAYLSVGNHWAVQRLCKSEYADKFSSSPEFFRLLALSHLLSEDSFAAEAYYNKWKQVGDEKALISANYGLSMLYLRHHPKDLRNQRTAVAFLDEAYAATKLQKGDAFSEIFNRNGFALVLFRQGKVQEAIRLLSWAISELKKMSGKRALMHRSVIEYNLSQCFGRTGQYEEAVNHLEEVLKIDPNYAEYRVDLADYLANLNRHEEAITQLSEAIKLEGGLVSPYSKRAKLFMERDEYESALKDLRFALMLDRRNFNVVYARYFCLSSMEDYGQIVSEIDEDLQIWSNDSDKYQDLLILKAEAISNTDSIPTALNLLEGSVLQEDRSEHLDQAINTLLSA